ncbi:squamous cell carcinoma antigen recognized by T-cells 3-like [Oppia nitens]|uniref:squamous cell carcinoma antigen recognized by T-cells 3-like n=1 Tax=Oppia nitens TaxID=1686743 RepID=UPI0023D9C6E4|nr:squamous cell carcinoma antigen recognized by T-cells 3-like [Oppia nitens]
MDSIGDKDMDNNNMDEDMSDNDNSDEAVDDDSDDDNEDQQIMLDINRLQEELSINSYDYQKHMDLIDKLESCDELELIREARERMSRVYPLTPSLWLKWINDEIRIATTLDEKSNIIKLFDRAVNDYTSLDIWLEYVQYSIGLMDTLGVDGIRRIFERSLTYVGLNVDKGVLIWDTFREFEKFILQSMDGEEQHLNDELKKQIDRILELYRRQLSLPLLGMDNSYSEGQEWCKTIVEKYSIDINFDSIKAAYDKAFNELQKLIPYEEALQTSEAPHYEQYIRYIEYETHNSTPQRVQSIYERALIDNCLISDLWHKYVTYLDKKVVIDTILLPVYERAVRNCTWSSIIWISYLRALERLKSDHKKVMETLESALEVGFQDPNEYLQTWLTYLDYLRRKTNWKDDNEVKSLRNTFEKAVEHLTNIDSSDPNCLVLQYWAKIEAKFCNNIEKSRELWNELMKSRPDISSQAQNWITFSRLEKQYGNDKHYRKILLRGLNASSDWPESVGQLLLEFEREEGVSIESFDEVFNKFETIMNKTNEKRIKLAEREAEEKKRQKTNKKAEKYELKRAAKRKAGEQTSTTIDDKLKLTTADVDADGFKIPQTSVSTPKKSKTEINESKIRPVIETKDDKSRSSQTSDSQQSEVPTHGVTYKGDGSKDLQTVFVSNLDFKINETQLGSAFEKFGQISDIRLVRNYKGLSKGYAYVEYESISSVKDALKHDRMPLEGRPVFISEMGRKAKFSFSSSVEKHKIYVKNLSFDTKIEDLRKVFEKYGSLKDVRLVTYRNGHSKGCAYVEFTDESSAQLAVKESDGLLVDNRNIIVAISNPNAKPISREDRTFSSVQTANGSDTFTRYSKTRINAPMIPTALRVQRQTQNGDKETSSGSTSNSGQPLSNNDFRNLLLTKK